MFQGSLLPRAFVRAVAAALLAALAGAVSAAATNDWPQLGHDAAHSYSNPAEKALKPSRFKDMQLLWQKHLGNYYLGASMVGAGRVINCSNLQAVGAQDAANGETLWALDTLRGDRGCLSGVLDTDTLWLTTSDSNGKLYVSALDPSSGASRWQRKLTAVGNRLSPVSDGKRLFVGDVWGSLYALSARTGRQDWKADIGCTMNEPTAGDGLVVVSTKYDCGKGSVRLVALNDSDGSVRWRRALSADSLYAPLLQAGRAHVLTTDGWVRTFDAARGTPLWALQLDRAGNTYPLVGGGDTVFAADRLTVYAFDAATGALRWKTAPANVMDISSNLVLAAGSLVHTVRESDGIMRLAVINAATGKAGPRNAAAMNGSFAQLTVADGRVQVATNDGYLFVFGLPAR